MKDLRTWVWFLCILLLFLGGGYWFAFEWVVPKTASFTMPQKWHLLPLQQPREIVHDYLGEPITPGNPTDSTKEEWSSGSKEKRYVLRMYYLKDSIVTGYSIHYRYRNWLFKKDYLLDSISIR